jgi:hypothetical protein
MRLGPVAAALAVALPSSSALAVPEARERLVRERVEGLFAGLVEELDRSDRAREREARERGERLGDLERSLRLLGLAAGHLLRGSNDTAGRTVGEVEGLLARVAPDPGHFAGPRVAELAGEARRAAGIARDAIEEGNRSRGLAAIRAAGLYAARARNVAAASVLPVFEE